MEPATIIHDKLASSESAFQLLRDPAVSSSDPKQGVRWLACPNARWPVWASLTPCNRGILTGR